MWRGRYHGGHKIVTFPNGNRGYQDVRNSIRRASWSCGCELNQGGTENWAWYCPKHKTDEFVNDQLQDWKGAHLWINTGIMSVATVRIFRGDKRDN